MFGGNNENYVLPEFLDETQFQCQNNAANHLQMFENCEYFLSLPFIMCDNRNFHGMFVH